MAALQPRFNTFGLFFWGGYALAEVVQCKPETIDDLKAVVEEVAANIEPELVCHAFGNLKKRAELCLEAGGGHFEFAMD